MVAVFTKELVGAYLITLKLREKLEVAKKSIPDPDVASTSQQQQARSGKGKPAALQLAAPASPAESEWVISIRERIKGANREETACPWGKVTIYHVPKTLRESDEKAYVPQLVSIGPFHRGKRRLREMDCHKWRSLNQTLRRTNQDVRLYIDSIRSLEARARECYEDEISLSSDEFVECMLLDGCFILELFRGVVGGFSSLGYSACDPVFAMRGSMHIIQRDMIMLENQIPLFVLDRILALQLDISENQRGDILIPLILRFFDPLMPTGEPFRKLQSNANTKAFDPLSQDGLHCLDVFHRSLLRKESQLQAPKIWRKRRSHTIHVVDRRRQQLVNCVTDLQEAGIRFRRHQTDRFWDIKFENGVLYIPRLMIHDGTKSLFLNLMAFEQCQLDMSNNITSYVIFMDNIINSGEDVRRLHYRGIIEHWLGNDQEVADLFNNLCQEVVFDINDSYLSGLSAQVNRHYYFRWNVWKAILKHSYFNTPWAIISFIAAVVLLLLTGVQTFYGVYAFYKPSN